MLSKVILQAHIDKVETYFDRADKVVIVTHVSPDGDALGSSLGLYHFLSVHGKTVNVIVPNAFPDFCGGCLEQKILFVMINTLSLPIS